MSQADSTDRGRGVYVQKPKWDVYTTMLAISLVAILIAIVLLYLELSSYNFEIRPAGAIGAALDGASFDRLAGAFRAA